MISVILNVYKRPHMLERQIESILDQTILVIPTDIHVWYNQSETDQPNPKDVRIKTYRCNWNTKFFGRFTLPALCRNEYIAILDDDILPGERWFENCLNVINTEATNGILGGAGVTLLSKNTWNKVGWNGEHSEKSERVDYVGQSWFFRKQWSQYMWYEEPYSWDNGEDIMYSYLSQKYGGINTFVPPHPEGDKALWSTSSDVSMSVGRDRNASWRAAGHHTVRNAAYAHCMDNGWKTVNNL